MPDTSPPAPPQNMPPVQPIEPSLPAPINGNWYLLSVRSKKRESFLKYLNLAITQNNLQELILEIKIPQDKVYEDIVLLNLSNFNTANSQLQKIDHFQSLQRKPLPLAQVSRMIGN
ncbi:chromosome segregation ATPase [Nostoc sp. UHCC 0870]|uniref:chromosome segregation ATPase n=1 Tax=Nostoc sp. UHCC 0870 TaxID=2914041 RepID=UPI001EDC9906|nr:chromosome segregation ATPase [Nostoc sp. UHCC 0870]UKO97133.1 chromosome segregation ATPase [Nostoc sp. UHCC 0870]